MRLLQAGERPEAPQPEGLTVQLHPYQRQSPRFMLDDERGDGGHRRHFWTQHRTPGGFSFWRSPPRLAPLAWPGGCAKLDLHDEETLPWQSCSNMLYCVRHSMTGPVCLCNRKGVGCAGTRPSSSAPAWTCRPRPGAASWPRRWCVARSGSAVSPGVLPQVISLLPCAAVACLTFKGVLACKRWLACMPFLLAVQASDDGQAGYLMTAVLAVGLW